MQRITLVLVLLATTFCCSFGSFDGRVFQQDTDNALFMKSGLRWKKSTSTVPHAYQTAEGSVLVFHPMGGFEQVTSRFDRERNGALSIDLKGGYAVYKGNWGGKDSHSVTTAARLVYTSSPKTGEPGKEPEETDTCTFKNSGPLMTALHLVCGSATFDRISLQNAAELEESIRAHAKAAAK